MKPTGTPVVRYRHSKRTLGWAKGNGGVFSREKFSNTRTRESEDRENMDAEKTGCEVFMELVINNGEGRLRNGRGEGQVKFSSVKGRVMMKSFSFGEILR